MMKLKAAANYCRRMGVGLRAGVDILRLLETETKSGDQRHREAMAKVQTDIQGGSTLGQAMKEQPKYFPKLLTQMVDASELGGRMDQMFEYMANYYDQLKQTRSDFIGQITWPLIQLALAIVIIGLVMLLQTFLGTGDTYDATGLGISFTTYCMVVCTFFLVFGITAYGLWKNWFNCHNIVVPAIQKIPVLGTAFITLALSRLSMTLSMLLNAGVEAGRATRQAYLATGNHYFIGGMDRSLKEIEKGSSFGDAFDASEVLPEDFVEAVRIGELSGTETESLDRLALNYQEAARSALRTIATIASTTIWISVMMLIAFMVIRMALQYIGLLTDAINNPMGN